MPDFMKPLDIISKLDPEHTKLGDLRKMAKEIKIDHPLAMELWSTGDLLPRLLAILIMDKKKINQEFVDLLDADIQHHEYEQRNQLTDWLLANQLMKNKKTITLLKSWEHSSSAIQRRLFWYYQARLRWTGQTPPANSQDLLTAIENRMANEKPEVQWAMNFTAAQIGIFESKYRSKCIDIGERLGLYKDEEVAKGCTPNYLPIFIQTQVDKLASQK